MSEINNIINYVMETPGNTNPNVLKGMLEKSNGSNNNIGIIDRNAEFINFYASNGVEEREIFCFVYEDISDDLIQVFIPSINGYEYFLANKIEKIIMSPVASSDNYRIGELCLIEQKEVYSFIVDDGQNNEIGIIKNTNGIVHGTKS